MQFLSYLWGAVKCQYASRQRTAPCEFQHEGHEHPRDLQALDVQTWYQGTGGSTSKLVLLCLMLAKQGQSVATHTVHCSHCSHPTRTPTLTQTWIGAFKAVASNTDTSIRTLQTAHVLHEAKPDPTMHSSLQQVNFTEGLEGHAQPSTSGNIVLADLACSHRLWVSNHAANGVLLGERNIKAVQGPFKPLVHAFSSFAAKC